MKQTTNPVSVVGNKDSGSIHVGQALDPRFQKNGLRPAAGELLINVEGEQAPRQVTYIMGSASKGWSLCAKGSGPFPSALTFTLTYEDGLAEE